MKNPGTKNQRLATARAALDGFAIGPDVREALARMLVPHVHVERDASDDAAKLVQMWRDARKANRDTVKAMASVKRAWAQL